MIVEAFDSNRRALGERSYYEHGEEAARRAALTVLLEIPEAARSSFIEARSAEGLLYHFPVAVLKGTKKQRKAKS
jgi:hypothetical protein